MTTTPSAASGTSRVDAAAARRGLTHWLGGSSRTSNLVIKTAAIVVLLVFWQLASVWQGALLVPSPLDVVQRMVEIVREGDFFTHMNATLLRVLAGLAVSMVVAVTFGVAMGLFRPIERFFEPYVLLGLTIPGLAWALMAVMAVGISNWAPVLAIVASTSPMVILNIWQGTKSIDTDVVEMGRAFRASRREMLRRVILPQLVPYILAGTRLGLALAWKIVVLSEMFGLSNGVGYQLNLNFTQFSLAGVVAWTLSFTMVMALIEFGLLQPIEKHVTRWRPSIKSGGSA